MKAIPSRPARAVFSILKAASIMDIVPDSPQAYSRVAYCVKTGLLAVQIKGTSIRKKYGGVSTSFRITEAGRQRLELLRKDTRLCH